MDSNSYEDILHMERPASRRRQMPRADRAKQFMPFAALRGFDFAIVQRGALARAEVAERERTVDVMADLRWTAEDWDAQWEEEAEKYE